MEWKEEEKKVVL